jgi:trans-o-hydroxybenzylidenepyruvate hydratase-aldolase
MLAAADLKGIMAMMPAFTTDDGGDIDATRTIDVQRLCDGVGRMLADGGADVIGATGSFGEATTLLPGELDTLVRATVETVAKRVPVVVGCIGLHSRDIVAQARIAENAGADAVMLGVPCYFPSTVQNAVQFLKDVADRFPKLGVLIYHNPPLHKIAIPVDAFTEIARIPNVIGMKDSHRTTVDFQRLADIVRGKMSLFVNHSQYNVYSALGAAGFWAIDIWMGPEPMIALREAVKNGDAARAREIAIAASFNRAGPSNMQWREVAHKIAVRYAGYCDPGPLRPPFIHVPDEVDQRQRHRAERWRALCKTYATAATLETPSAKR